MKNVLTDFSEDPMGFSLSEMCEEDEMQELSDLCRELLIINPQMNIIFLTAHTDYSIDAWNTGACGFLLKPIGPENIKKQLKFLRYPIKGLARLV